MAIFERKHVAKILTGQKTQTRRTHKHEYEIGRVYPICDNYYGKPQGYIKIIRKFRQRLGDMSSQDVKKEGYNSLEEFRKVWEEIYGPWKPDKIVIAYEFKLVSSKPATPGRKSHPLGSGTGSAKRSTKGDEKTCLNQE